MITSTLRGHTIIFDEVQQFNDGDTLEVNYEWCYADTGCEPTLTAQTTKRCGPGEPTLTAQTPKKCNHCGNDATPKGRDRCLGTLPGVSNACCGHGEAKNAYVQFDDWVCIRGAAALYFFKEMK